MPLTGGVIDGDLQVNGYLYIIGTIASPTPIMATGGVEGYLRYDDNILGLSNNNIVWGKEAKEHYITAEGDGTKFLADDGTYKTISSSSSGGSGAYAEVNHGTSDTTFTLTPNTFHIWDEVASLTLDLGTETSGVANEYLFQFTSGSTPTTLSLPDDITWTNELAIEPNMIYQVSILKGLASVLEWNNTPTLIENKATLTGSTIEFQYPVASELTIKVGMNTITMSAGEKSHQIEYPEPGMIIMNISPISDSTYYYTF